MDKTATPVPEKYLTGSQAEQDSTKGMTSPSYKTPGKTVRLYGVESNTDFRNGENWKSVPAPEGIVDIEYGVSDAPTFKVVEND